MAIEETKKHTTNKNPNPHLLGMLQEGNK